MHHGLEILDFRVLFLCIEETIRQCFAVLRSTLDFFPIFVSLEELSLYNWQERSSPVQPAVPVKPQEEGILQSQPI